MHIKFKLLEDDINISLHTGINGLHRIVFDEDSPTERYQIPLTTPDIDILISKLKEMRRAIRRQEGEDSSNET